MIGTTERGQIAAILTASQCADTELPKGVQSAHERAQKVVEGGQHLGTGTDALAAAVTASLLADEDPAASPDVQRAVVAQALSANHGLSEEVAAAAYHVVREELSKTADQIVGSWVKAFDTAADTLQDAHRQFGDVSLEDHGAIIGTGPDAAAVWGQARAAVATINTIGAGWLALVSLCRLASTSDRSHAVLRIADVDYQTWTRHRGLKAQPWDAVRVGLALSLPTAEQYTARVRTITQAELTEHRKIDARRDARVFGRA